MDIAKCVRIFEPDPDDAFVTERRAAIRELGNRLSRRQNISGRIATVNGVCGVFRDPSSIPDSLATQIEGAIKKKSASFARDGRDLELGVCATAAVVQLINSGKNVRNGWSAADMLAASLWSALSFLPTCNASKLESFRKLAVGAARGRTLSVSLAARVRHDVPELEAFDAAKTTPEDFASEAAQTIDELRINAAFDREEIDVLRWGLGGVSEIFGRPLHLLSPATRVITTGVEIGAFMQALPTQSHRNLALRDLEETNLLPLPELLVALGDGRVKISDSFEDEPLIDQAPLVFPLLSAIRSGKGNGLGAALPRSLSEWGARALLEHALLRVRL